MICQHRSLLCIDVCAACTSKILNATVSLHIEIGSWRIFALRYGIELIHMQFNTNSRLNFWAVHIRIRLNLQNKT